MVVSINNVSYAYLLAAVFGLYIGISETVQRAIIPKYVPTEFRGTAYGLYSLVIGVCFFASNITFGYLWDNHGLNTAVSYSLSFSAVSIFGMLLFIKLYSNAELL